MENTINEEGKWEVLQSEYLLKKAPWLTARKDVCRLPDGRINDHYYVLEYPDWVNIIAVTEDGDIILERQYRHGLGNTCYELPCGVIEEGETPLEAAKRELLEETGYAGGEWSHLMDLAPNPATSNNLAHSFLAVGVKKVAGQNLDPTEDITVYKKSPDFVRTLLENNQILQALMVAPLQKYLFTSL
ncbi:MAG: NUDIX hydrolase [Bacteroidales bacterium]|nr:NUDIX hydrolase [Bacteroidales bacterium]MBQ9529981.1 NUDIX hydrolase [Bacteroidales bacterium]